MEQNMYEWVRGRRHHFPEAKIKHYMYELMKALDHMHRNGIFHRDIKPENVLLADDVLKLADFGSCRGIYSKQPFTEYISTRWYRAPECLLTDGYYNYKMDIWGVGCVFFEILTFVPLFPGENELDQIHKIHNILGTPAPELLEKFQKLASHMVFNFPPTEGSGFERLVTNASAEAKALIKKMLAYNPDDRISARQVMKDPYFRELREMEQPSKGMPNVTGMLTRGSLVSDGDHAGGNEDSSRKGESFARDESPQLPPIKNPGLMAPKQKPKRSLLEEQKIPHNPSTKSITVELKNPAALRKPIEPKKSFVSPYVKKPNKHYL